MIFPQLWHEPKAIVMARHHRRFAMHPTSAVHHVRWMTNVMELTELSTSEAIDTVGVLLNNDQNPKFSGCGGKVCPMRTR